MDELHGVVQGAIKALEKLPEKTTAARDPHKHCRWCREPIPLEYNKNFCDDRCRSMNGMSLMVLMAFVLGGVAYFLAVVGL